jgi:hypothetical protein
MFRAYVKDKYNMSNAPKQSMDIQSLIAFDSRIKHVNENVCKSCKNKHIKGCCSGYSRSNRSKMEYIVNAEYSPSETEEHEYNIAPVVKAPEVRAPVVKSSVKLFIKCKQTPVSNTRFKKVCDACSAGM